MDESACEKTDRPAESSEYDAAIGPVKFVFLELSPEHPQIDEHPNYPRDQRRNSAFERELQRRRMHMADRLAAVVEHVPFEIMVFDRIHSDADGEMPWVREQKVGSFAPDH